MIPSRPFLTLRRSAARLIFPILDWANVYRFSLARIGIVIAVLAGAALLGYVGGEANPFYAIIAASAPLLLLGSDQIGQRKQLTPILILVAGLFIPLALPTGTGSRLVISLVLTCLLLGLWLVNMMSADRRFWLFASPVNLPLVGFIAVTIISYVWSLLFRDPLVATWSSFGFVQLASTVVMVALPGVFLLTANQVNDRRALKAMVWIMLGAGFLGLVRNYSGLPIPVNMGGMFNMWVIALATAQGLFNRWLSRWTRWAMLALAAAWVWWGLVLHISWLAGWLPGLLALAVIIVMRSKWLTLAVGAALFVAALIYWDTIVMYTETIVSAEAQESGLTRLAAWEVNWRVTGQHWLFGTGPGGYAAYYMTYFPFEGTATHSNFIDILAQTGVAGLLTCLLFFVTVGWLGFRISRRLSGSGGFEEALAVAAFAGTLGAFVMMGFGDWLFPFAYTQTIAGFDYAAYNWLFMGTIPVIDRLTRKNGKPHRFFSPVAASPGAERPAEKG